jgi:GT2 family glycosyltransferase
LGDIIAISSHNFVPKEFNPKNITYGTIFKIMESQMDFMHINSAISIRESKKYGTHAPVVDRNYNAVPAIPIKGLDTDSNYKFSLIIPTAFSATDEKLNVIKLLDSLFQNVAASRLEVIFVVDETSFEAMLFEIARHPITFDFKIIKTKGKFNYSKAINSGVVNAKYDHLILLNDDIVITDSIDFRATYNLLENVAVGAVGIKLIYPNGTIQHAGIEYRDGEPQHFLKGSSQLFLKHSHSFVREISGVTGAFLAIKKDFFLSLGGLDENLPLDYNDVDLMLRIHKLNKSVLMDGASVGIHLESASRGKNPDSNIREALDYLLSKHGPLPDRDPYLYTPAELN